MPLPSSELSTAPLARYVFRRSVLEEDRAYSIHPDRIVVEGAGLSGEYPLAEVEAVHLKYERTKQRGYYQCLIRTKRGRISLRHVHWKGVGNFEDRRATYTPFVKTMLAQLKAYPNVRFKAGSMVNFIAAIVGVPVMTALALLAASHGRTTSALLAAFFVVLCLVMIAPSRPRRFDPLAPPADLLPE